MPENKTSDHSWSFKIRDLVQEDLLNCFRASSIYETGAIARPRSDLVQHTLFEPKGEESLCCYGLKPVFSGLEYWGLFGERYSSHNDTKYPVLQVGPSPDYTAIKAWLEHCRSNHTECDVGEKFDLSNTSLIDVNKRVLVKYPPEAEYVTLSYVWGKTAAPHFDRNAILPDNLPQTIDDAMTATRHLGFSYIWIDALCIDQTNLADKKHQISLMDRIYEAAIATIVALDGRDANSGLGGVGTGCTRIPQWLAQFGPYEALSRCPGLSQESFMSAWSKRGWTFQEEVLSRRCVFFTRHQVYYRCESMFCSEDYHDQEKFGFSRTDQSTISIGINSPFNSRVKSSLHGTERGPYRNHKEHSDMYIKYEPLFRDYCRLLRLYLSRNLSDEADSLNAFSAILSRLEKASLPGKFAGGLPLGFMRQALQWNPFNSDYDLRGQSNSNHLPSWSWAGWKVREIDILDPELFRSGAEQPPLRIWTFDDVIHRSGFMIPDIKKRQEHINMVDIENSVESSQNAWIKNSKNSDMSSITDDWNKNSVPEAAIFVEATLVTFHKRNLYFRYYDGSLTEIDASSGNTLFLARARYSSVKLEEYFRTKDSGDFILLSQDGSNISTILLDWNDGMATRIDLVRWEFDYRFLEPNIPRVLGLFDMRVARFWWV